MIVDTCWLWGFDVYICFFGPIFLSVVLVFNQLHNSVTIEFLKCIFRPYRDGQIVFSLDIISLMFVLTQNFTYHPS